VVGLRGRVPKGWRLVAFGDVGGVEGAFGVDAVSTVLLTGSAAPGHHDPAIAGRSINRWGSGQFTGRQAQAGKQQSTTGTSVVDFDEVLMRRKFSAETRSIKIRKGLALHA
jgi:hypothetical protein